MKKTITFILGFVLGAICAAGVYFATAGNVAWDVYIEEKLLPNAVLALSTISALCMAALPIVNKVQAASEKFTCAASDVNETVAGDNALAEQITACKKEFSDAISEIKDLKAHLEKPINEVKATADNIEKVVRIGFGGNTELVKKGYVREIEKVGADNGTGKKA